MKIFRDLDKIPTEYKNAVVVLGNFDGFHLGHKSIVEHAGKIAAEKSLPLVVMSFEPHPKEFFGGNKTYEKVRIANLHDKIAGMKEAGVGAILLTRFNQKLADMGAEDFVKQILVKQLAVKYVVTGDNFCFGKGRRGDKNLLGQMAADLGFGYLPCDHITTSEGKIISSSAIREFLKTGELKKAGELIGKPYTISGRVVHGEKRGRELGFPTANIRLGKLFAPRLGIYAAQVKLEDELKTLSAVASIGAKPTFGSYKPLLEVHIFDTEKNLYGKRICVQFKEFIRDEIKFDSTDELIKQMHDDCKKAKELLA